MTSTSPIMPIASSGGAGIVLAEPMPVLPPLCFVAATTALFLIQKGNDRNQANWCGRQLYHVGAYGDSAIRTAPGNLCFLRGRRVALEL
ncbi:hypothetical protein [Rhizobium lentis]|uniref:Uncharacterized protein n=1 Tax=Rhizobium lentis TaxID=1138194 RepID=A0A7W8XF21_9HYPH|nr:hypothetical protein [Rhizobium lentis]MBB5550892.1 hypothetical protein [Rhizobium lentis]MBB5561426.1 hypothetical protein [Rhizobium lentis]MBB5568011.1 hypothetical protein [Rhizobium lentis]